MICNCMSLQIVDTTIAASAQNNRNGTTLLVKDSAGHAPFSSSCPSSFRLQDGTWTVPLWLEAPAHSSLQLAGPCALQAVDISALTKLHCQVDRPVNPA